MYCVTRYVNWYVIARKNTTRNRKTSTLRVTLLKKSEGVGRIVTVVTAVTKESWVCFGLNWNTSCRQAASCFPYALWISKSLLWHWLPAIEISGLSKLIYIPLLKVLSVLDVYSWYSDLSFRLWVFDVIAECLDNLVSFSFCSGGGPTANSACICKLKAR